MTDSRAAAKAHHLPSLQDQLLAECRAMAQFALANGHAVPSAQLQRLDAILSGAGPEDHAERVVQLNEIQQTLAKAVAPCLPSTIVLLGRGSGHRLNFLGPVPLIRQLSSLAIFFLIGLLAVSLSGNVNVENLNLGLLNSEGEVLLYNQLFLLCAAGLGASFSALFKANAFVAKVTYDPRYDSSYWSQIILGIIAGVILVELLPASLFAGSDFGKPTLAMFGGFSATVVHRILVRLVDTLETMVKGPADDSASAATLRAQGDEQRSRVNAEMAAQLLGLSHKLDQGDAKDAAQQVNGMVQKLLGKASS